MSDRQCSKLIINSMLKVTSLHSANLSKGRTANFCEFWVIFHTIYMACTLESTIIGKITRYVMIKVATGFYSCNFTWLVYLHVCGVTKGFNSSVVCFYLQLHFPLLQFKCTFIPHA